LSNFSWIQYHILAELTRHKDRRYSQLRPRDVEGNLFMYHLKGLMGEGLVEKLDKQYQLTAKGLQFAATLSLSTGRTRKQPQILVAVVAKNEKGEYLWSRWHRQPNTGMVSFPHGMMHYGERAVDMAALELAEKAGLEGDLSHMGEVYVRVALSGELDGHILVHIFEVSNYRVGRQDELRTDMSEAFWAPLTDMSKADFLPGFYEIANMVDSRGDCAIFEDITVEL